MYTNMKGLTSQSGASRAISGAASAVDTSTSRTAPGIAIDTPSQTIVMSLPSTPPHPEEPPAPPP